MTTPHPRSLKCAVALSVVCLILCTPISSFSWGAGGHMIVAKIAFGRLNPRAKAEVARLLAIQIEPAGVTIKDRDFVNASHWADDLRPFSEFDEFLALHFIDTPFSDDGTELPDVPSHNIVRALKRNVQILKTSHDDNKRAQALRFIIHFVGDIHQPLHCATRVSSDEPEGDHGGNFVFVKVPAGQGKLKRVKLHSYWDGGLGSFPPMGKNFAPPPLSSIGPAAAKATSANPPTDPKIKLDDPFAFQAWADESFDLAKTVVYRGIQNNSKPDQAYRTQGVEVARKRVAWGGYRLAALLNSIWP